MGESALAEKSTRRGSTQDFDASAKSKTPPESSLTERQLRRRAKREERLRAKAKRPKIRKWRGLLADESRRVRIVWFVVIVVAMASLSFTQLGFLGLGLPGDYDAYCITLLAPVALCALLFGMPLGTLGGFAAGGLLYVHALLQPLDYYEVNFVTPFSSIVLFTFTGLFLSFLFAVALRNNPSRVRTLIYIFIICFVVAALFSTVFVINALITLISHYAGLYTMQYAADNKMVAQNDFTVSVLASFMRMGRIDLQVFADMALMVVFCYAAYFAVGRRKTKYTNPSLSTVFRLWLFVATALVLFITVGCSFIVITEQAKADAKADMDSEIDYLVNQLKASDERVEHLSNIIAIDAVSERSISDDEAQGLQVIASKDNLLEGYTRKSDGVIVVIENGVVVLSDDKAIPKGASEEEFLGEWMMTLHSIADSGEMAQIVFDENTSEINSMLSDDSQGDLEAISAAIEEGATSQMGFMRAKEYADYVIMVVYSSTKVFEGRTSVMLWTTLSIFVLLLTVFLVASRLLGSLVVRKIDETNGVLSQITEGNLDARVNIRDSKEFDSLSSGINTTVAALKEWISEAESRMDQELATAKAIQESALPRTFPPFPDIHRFDVYASMHPAREVGGDFYDFFIVGDNTDGQVGKLGFVIADVSGKGVPAALFMMAAKTEIRNYLESGMEPGEAIENANRQLCGGNDAGMFVTVFAGTLDYETGHMLYVNAGHNPPLLWQEGSWRWLKDVSGMPLGLFDGFPYDTYECDLQIGEELFLYTDGVTEAMNVSGELFGEERLEALMRESFTLHPRSLVETTRRALTRYARGAEQSDDITMLALEYGVPPELTATLVVKADVDELPNVNDFIHTELDRRLCPLKVQKQLDIALEELFVNVARYAYPDATPEKPGHVRISYTYSAEPPSVLVEIVDKGVPYNPLAKPDAVTPDDIMEVPIGGLGILMAKNSVDEMTYEYRDGSNVVAFTKKW